MTWVMQQAHDMGAFKTRTSMSLSLTLIWMKAEVEECQTIPDAATRAYVKDLEKKIATIRDILAERDKTETVF